jgi:hypothetical protein
MGSSMTYLLNFRVHAVVRKIESRYIQYTGQLNQIISRGDRDFR